MRVLLWHVHGSWATAGPARAVPEDELFRYLPDFRAWPARATALLERAAGGAR
ncbi:hypothetical protein ABTZ58_01755 [Streptomyces sp. NPDC094143]|uniref:hypothetical protein n=1 Tax=Streptomyces sp. NPDC094143 TaxID=3155310 RepID=UPI0033324506